MSPIAPRAAARLVAVAGALAAVLFLGRTASLTRAAPGAAAPPPVETFDYDAALVRFTGQLSEAATRELRGLDLAGGDTALVLVITEQDVLTCEDLGRQIRELRRAYGADRPIAVWADSAGSGLLRSFLRRERIARATVGTVPPSAVLSDGTGLWTPAAILATPDGRIVEGVSHTRRSPNVRLQSFAQELTPLSRASAAREGGATP